MLPYQVFVLFLLSSAISALPSVWPVDTAGNVSLPLTRRSRSSMGRSRRRDGPYIYTPIHNDKYDYTVEVNLGTPPKKFNLLLDTGSSDIFFTRSDCACAFTSFDPSKSSTFSTVAQLSDYKEQYSGGVVVSGFYGYDWFGVDNGIVKQVIAVVTNTNANKGAFEDGILGIGLDETESAVPKLNGQHYDGYISNLKKAGKIGSRVYSIHMNARRAGDVTDGTILFGGYDKSKYTGNLIAFPLVEPAPDGQYRLDVAEPSISYGLGSGWKSVSGGSQFYVVVMDTGTSFSYIPEAQFNVISKAVGAQIIGKGAAYSVDCALAQQPDGLNFNFQGPHGSVTVNVPWAEMVVGTDGLPAGVCTFGLVPQSNDAAHDTYVLGDTFLRSAYLVFDYDNLVVGIGQAAYTK